MFEKNQFLLNVLGFFFFVCFMVESFLLYCLVLHVV